MGKGNFVINLAVTIKITIYNFCYGRVQYCTVYNAIHRAGHAPHFSIRVTASFLWPSESHHSLRAIAPPFFYHGGGGNFMHEKWWKMTKSESVAIPPPSPIKCDRIFMTTVSSYEVQIRGIFSSRHSSPRPIFLLRHFFFCLRSAVAREWARTPSFRNTAIVINCETFYLKMG